MENLPSNKLFLELTKAKAVSYFSSVEKTIGIWSNNFPKDKPHIEKHSWTATPTELTFDI